jgi:hypothetical protein
MKASFQSSPGNVPDTAGSERQSGGLNVPDAIAVVSAVSSSIKFSLFEEHDTELALKAHRQVEGVYTSSDLIQPPTLTLLVEQEIQ